MDRKLAEIVGQIPRRHAEAEPLAEFPIEHRKPGRIEAAIPVQASQSQSQQLREVEIERIGRPKAMTEAEYAERKRLLPPLSRVSSKGKPEKDKRYKFLTFDHNRRDFVQADKQAVLDKQARIELFHAVKAMRRRDQPKG